jgi:hypothetical protein
MRFTTASGSVYEVDEKAKKIRRLNGTTDLSPRMGKEGEWRPYKRLLPDPIKVGSGVAIVWGEETELLAETKEQLQTMGGGFAMPMTTTSMVMDIDNNIYN